MSRTFDNMQEMLTDVNEAKPLCTKNGQNIYSFEDGDKIRKANLTMEKAGMKAPSVGRREMSENGMYYKSGNYETIVVNPEVLFKNRYRKVEETEKGADGKETKKISYHIVTDERAIDEQDSGLIYKTDVTYYVIEKKGRRGLEVTDIQLASADEFVKEFKGVLDYESMAEVLTLIEGHTQAEVTKGKLTF